MLSLHKLRAKALLARSNFNKLMHRNNLLALGVIATLKLCFLNPIIHNLIKILLVLCVRNTTSTTLHTSAHAVATLP